MKRKPRTQFFKRSQLLLGSLGGFGLLSTSILAQTPPRAIPLTEERSAANVQQADGADLEQVEAVEYLTRGPLHEAFAEPYEADPRPSVAVPQQPPEAINEVPPQYRPEGENINWIPGYWAWDDDRSDFIWISGVWRDVPPDHQWVPGYWSQTSGGYQYISGFWASTQVAELEYLPPPPESLEQGPSSPAPGETYFYIPGHWVYDGNDYQWQPGYWSVNHENWVWIPAHYVWTPRGCIYQAGYWDYDIAFRGVVFTPVYYQQRIYRSAQYVYRPQYVVDTGPELFVHMFVRPNYGHYYYGDYYGSRYSSSYQPWATYYQGPQYYDPFYTNYRVRGQAANNLNLLSWIVNQHQLFVQNDSYRPAATIADQRNFLNASTSGNLDQSILRLANLGDSLQSMVSADNTDINFQQLSQNDVQRIVQTVAPLRDLGNQRLQVENQQNATATENTTVSLSETRQRMEAARGADTAVEANATADANVNRRPDSSTARDALSERQPQGEARGRDNVNTADNLSTQDLNRPDVVGDAAAEARQKTGPDAVAEARQAGRDAAAEARQKTGPDAVAEARQAGRDAAAEARQAGRDALSPQAQEVTPRGENDNAQRRPESNLPGPDANRPNRPDAETAVPDKTAPAAPRQDTRAREPARGAPDGRTPGAGIPGGAGTPGAGTPGAGTPDRVTPDLGARGRQNPNSRDPQNRSDTPSAQPLDNLTPGTNDLRNRPNADSQGRNSRGPRPAGADRNNRAPLESNQGLPPGASQRPSLNPTAPGAAGNSQSRTAAPDAGGVQRMRPARPQDWPSAPRRELGRGVPETPQIQSPQSRQDKRSSGSSTPERGKAPRSANPASPPPTSTPEKSAPAPQASAPAPQASAPAPQASEGNKGRGPGSKEQGKPKDKKDD